MEEVLCRLIEAPTTLGNEEPARRSCADAFREIGLEPVDMPLDEEMLRAHPAASPFSWDVSGKRNVVADWAAGRRRAAARSCSTATSTSSRRPPRASGGRRRSQPSRDGDWLYGRGSRRHEGRAGGDPRRGQGPPRARPRPARAGPAAVGRRGGVHRQRRAAVRGQRPARRRVRRHGAVSRRSVSISQVGVLWFHVDIAGLPAHAGDAQDGANAIEASFPIVAALRRLEAELNESPPAPYDTFDHPINLNVGVLRGGDWPSTVAAECTLSCRLALYPGQRGRVAAGEGRGGGRRRRRRASVPRRASAAGSLRRLRVRRRRDRAPITRS